MLLRHIFPGAGGVGGAGGGWGGSLQSFSAAGDQQRDGATQIRIIATLNGFLVRQWKFPATCEAAAGLP